MKKLLFTTAIALMFTTPAYADPGQGGGQGMQRDGPDKGRAGCGCTLVQQLTERMNYHKHEWEEEGMQPGYHQAAWRNAQQRLAKIAKTGVMGPPLAYENGNQVQLGHYDSLY